VTVADLQRRLSNSEKENLARIQRELREKQVEAGNHDAARAAKSAEVNVIHQQLHHTLENLQQLLRDRK
jgi:hypothetical protein